MTEQMERIVVLRDRARAAREISNGLADREASNPWIELATELDAAAAALCGELVAPPPDSSETP